MIFCLNNNVIEGQHSQQYRHDDQDDYQAKEQDQEWTDHPRCPPQGGVYFFIISFRNFDNMASREPVSSPTTIMCTASGGNMRIACNGLARP